MERSSFFNAELVNEQYDRVYQAEDFARYFASFIGNGVFADPTTNLQIRVYDGMSVVVETGKAYINGYFYENTEPLGLTLSVADGVLNRVDRIVLRLDLVNREIKCLVKSGSSSSQPVPPELQRDSDIYELALADIYVAKGVTRLTQSVITDQRFSDNLCGVVAGVVSQIDTTNLFTQFQTAFELWFEGIKEQLSTDQAGNLQLQIEHLQQSMTTELANYLPLIGGELTGSLVMSNGMAGAIRHKLTSGESIVTLYLSTANKLSVGNGEVEVYLNSKGNPKVLIEGTAYTLYHTGNKPTVGDVGATSSTTPLASGAWFMNANQTVTLSKKISECQHGICLEWRDYDSSQGKANAKDIVYTFIPKAHASRNNGKPLSILLPVYEQGSTSITKYVYVYNDKITGYATNSTATNANMVVLSAVYEV